MAVNFDKAAEMLKSLIEVPVEDRMDTITKVMETYIEAEKARQFDLRKAQIREENANRIRRITRVNKEPIDSTTN